ncbi:MAG: hypothetical protein WAW39_18055 [Prosthecobacter sp.]|uniref:hypothetical protein n=1 Tax=Prosthecobacter sp. TaxID=1965333 RepID=UPI003BB08AA5
MFKESNRLVPTLSAKLKFKRKSSSQWAATGGILASLLLCSCKEKDALLKEQKDLQIALNQAKAELDTYQVKINAVLPNLPAAAATLEVQLKASEKANAELTQTVNEVSSKATRLQDQLNKLRPKVEAYKAKYLR